MIPLEKRTNKLYQWLLQFISDAKKEKFEEKLNYRTRYFTAVLENVIDHHNTNGVIRSCEALGMQDAYIISNMEGFKAAKSVNKGSHKWMNIHKYKQESTRNLQTCVSDLKEKGYSIIVTAPYKNDFTPETIDINKPLAICFGQESTGITQELMEQADGFLKIPMYGFTESFNISVAAGIVFYELNKRLRESKINWQLSEAEKNEIRWQWLEKCLDNQEYLLRRFKADFPEQDLLS